VLHKLALLPHRCKTDLIPHEIVELPGKKKAGQILQGNVEKDAGDNPEQQS
jgi:hypothetical protein